MNLRLALALSAAVIIAFLSAGNSTWRLAPGQGRGQRRGKRWLYRGIACPQLPQREEEKKEEKGFSESLVRCPNTDRRQIRQSSCPRRSDGMVFVYGRSSLLSLLSSRRSCSPALLRAAPAPESEREDVVGAHAEVAGLHGDAEFSAAQQDVVVAGMELPYRADTSKSTLHAYR